MEGQLSICKRKLPQIIMLFIVTECLSLSRILVTTLLIITIDRDLLLNMILLISLINHDLF